MKRRNCSSFLIVLGFQLAFSFFVTSFPYPENDVENGGESAAFATTADDFLDLSEISSVDSETTFDKNGKNEEEVVPNTQRPFTGPIVVQPLNVTITRVTDKEIDVKWHLKGNAQSVQGHKVHYIKLFNSADAHHVIIEPNTNFASLSNLNPSTAYKIFVTGFTDKETQKQNSDEVTVITADKGQSTSVNLPSIVITNVDCVGAGIVDLQLESTEPKALTKYFFFVEYKPDSNEDQPQSTKVWNHTEVQMVTSRLNNSTIRLNLLNLNHLAYEVRIKTGVVYENATEQLVGNHYSKITTIQNCKRDNIQMPPVLTNNSNKNSTSNNISTSTTTSLPVPLEGSNSDVYQFEASTQRSNNLIPTPTLSAPDIQFKRKELEDVNSRNANVDQVAIIGTEPSVISNVVPENTTGVSVPSSSNSTMIALSVAASVILLVVLVVLLLWRNSKHCRSFCVNGGNYYVDDPPRLPLLGSNNGNIGWDGDGAGNNTSMTCTGPGLKNSNSSTNVTVITSSTDDQQQTQQPQQFRESIPIHLFPKHVTELHTDGDIGFSKEYDIIQSASLSNEEFTSDCSNHPENKLKNRYLNIVAYDHTLVRVQSSGSGSNVRGCGLGSMGNGLSANKKRTAGYINANYIDGFQKPYAYIGSQGPLPSTFDTFWTVVWEHNVTTIVMITNLIERGRKKCDMYWPKEIGSSETYGFVNVKLVKEQIMATYTLRTFLVLHQKVKKKGKKKLTGKFGSSYSNSICGNVPVDTERVVYHYHYTNWPDHGTPSHTLPVLSFVKKSSQSNASTNGGPIIVHCSAGVGRTGTYIVLDAMLKQISVRGDVNVFGFLRHIRSQRNFLVQTEEQYIFIHDALLEAIQSGDTNVEQNSIANYMNSLVSKTCMDETGKVTTLLEHHFKLITEFQPKEFQTSSSLKACNVNKVRNPTYICTDGYRVLLTPKAGIEGSDYINASFLPGYEKLHEFILTQHPLESTITSFWQMLCDQNVQTVVVLSSVDDTKFPTFWPTAVNEDLELDTFRVRLLEESDRVGYVLRDLSIQSLADDDELNIKMIQSSDWPYHCASIQQSIFQLIDVVMESVRDTTSSTPQAQGPIVVVDKFGGREGATFCSLTTVVKQMEFESAVDVYMYAKLYHEQRPGVWKAPEDYFYMYRALAELTSGVKDEEGDDATATTSTSSSTASTNTSSATGPPSPSTEPATSTTNTPLRQENSNKKPGPVPKKDEMIVVVQIDNEAKETDQTLMPISLKDKLEKNTSPSVSSNSSVSLRISPFEKHSPTAPTCSHLLKTIQHTNNVAPSPLPCLDQLELQTSSPKKIEKLNPSPVTPRTASPTACSALGQSKDIVLLPTESKANSLRPASVPIMKTPSPILTTMKEPSPLVGPITLSTSSAKVVERQHDPSQMLTPDCAKPLSPTEIQKQKTPSTLVQSPKIDKVDQFRISPILSKAPSPVETSRDLQLQTLSPGLKAPSPTTSPKAVTSPCSPTKLVSTSPTKQELNPVAVSRRSPVIQTLTPTKFEAEDTSSSSLPTPSPPPPPLPSSPPPPGCVSVENQGWGEVVGVMNENDSNMLAVTPPPPPPTFESPMSASPKAAKKKAGEVRVKSDDDEEVANLPPPPFLSLPGHSEIGLPKLEQETHQEQSHMNGKSHNGTEEPDLVSSAKSSLLEGITEEDEGNDEQYMKSRKGHESNGTTIVSPLDVEDTTRQ